MFLLFVIFGIYFALFFLLSAKCTLTTGLGKNTGYTFQTAAVEVVPKQTHISFRLNAAHGLNSIACRPQPWKSYENELISFLCFPCSNSVPWRRRFCLAAISTTSANKLIPLPKKKQHTKLSNIIPS